MKASALIPVLPGTLGSRPVQLVDARLLHQFLEVGRDFTSWIKERIAEYRFVEGEDFLSATAPPIRGAGNRGRRTDYLLTLDMAKELAMVERTPKGRQARRYFIECERQLKAMRDQGASVAMASLTNYPVVIDLLNADINGVNRQAWADVAGENAARFHARREELLRQQRLIRSRAAHLALMEFNRPVWAR
jgi:phage anti-repressor protein